VGFEAGVISTGLDYLDSEIGGLRCGRIYLIKGKEDIIDNFIYRTIIRNTLDLERAVAYVDCKNSFNPYQIARVCRKSGLSEKKVLEKVLISRPFTAYQLNTLVEEGLADALAKRPAVFVFSGLLDLFKSEDVTEDDAKVILERVLKDLKGMARADFPLILTHASHRGKDLPHVASASDTVYSLRPREKQGLRFGIEKDPLAPPEVIDFTFSSGAQALLDDYLEACQFG
jgi:hypothetical protein